MVLGHQRNALPRSIRFDLAQELMVHAFARADKVQAERIRVFRRYLGQNLLQHKLPHQIFIGELAVSDDDDIQAALCLIFLDRPAQGFGDIRAAARPVPRDCRLERRNAADVSRVGNAVVVEGQVVADAGQRRMV